MDSETQVVALTSTMLSRASEVVSAAFFDYPMFTFYFPNRRRRERNLVWYLRNVLRSALQYGAVSTTPDVTGVLFTLPPGHTRLTIPEYVRNGFLLAPLKLGIRNYVRSMKCEAFVAELQEEIMAHRPHIYLWGLAVAPEVQSRGIGSALLRHLMDSADQSQLPIYLETHKESNVDYYQQHGFALAAAARFAMFDLPIWCMTREPSVPSG